MAKGNVDFFNDTGGYGFISTDDADDDVFFHMEDVGGPDLEEGTDIEFDIEQAPRAPRHQRHPPVIRHLTFGNGFYSTTIHSSTANARAVPTRSSDLLFCTVTSYDE